MGLRNDSDIVDLWVLDARHGRPIVYKDVPFATDDTAAIEDFIAKGHHLGEVTWMISTKKVARIPFLACQ